MTATKKATTRPTTRLRDLLKLNYPRLEGEGFKWGRFEIDHRLRGQAPPLAH